MDVLAILANENFPYEKKKKPENKTKLELKVIVPIHKMISFLPRQILHSLHSSEICSCGVSNNFFTFITKQSYSITDSVIISPDLWKQLLNYLTCPRKPIWLLLLTYLPECHGSNWINSITCSNSSFAKCHNYLFFIT